jgi:conjugative transfer pilus assembly protein TraH
MIGTDGKYGGFSDYAAARQGCGAGGKREGVLEAGKEDPRFKHMMAGPFNLVWQAIRQNAFLYGKGRLASFFMSLSGTLIRRKAGDSYEMRVYPSLVGRESLLSALLYGGEATIYRAHDEEGLDVREEKVHIEASQSLVFQVKKLLLQIQQKVYDDQPLTAEELAFLNTTRLPFYKILNVATAYRRGGSPIDVLDYAELGAIDLLFQYLSEILDLVEESLTHLKAAAIDDSGIELFQNTLSEARRKVIRLRMGSFKQIEQILGIVAKTELLEKSLMVKAGALGEV